MIFNFSASKRCCLIMYELISGCFMIAVCSFGALIFDLSIDIGDGEP